MPDVSEFVVYEELIEDHRSDGLRAGEGSVVVLPDGSLFMVFGTFFGPKDHDKAVLLETRSKDGGITWSEKKTFLKTPDDVLNYMSVSSLALKDGRTALLYMRKASTEDCAPIFMTSSDGAFTWSEPKSIDDRGGYYVVNNDRLVQLSDGRILVPYAWHGFEPLKTLSGDFEPTYCGCFISDDAGETWRRSAEEIYVRPEDVVDPVNVDASAPGIDKFMKEHVICSQEPGVVELSDGSVMMWCRTSGGYAYKAFSSDGGDTYSAFTPIAEFAMPCGPQSIKAIPGSNRLLMLFNDRGEIPFGDPKFHWRRPLSMAVSDDDGRSWRSLGELEPDGGPTNCYFSICFNNDDAVFTYYEGVMVPAPDGGELPRNLASLKLKIVKSDFFRQT